MKTILSSRNKSSLPKNSQPGVYKINCNCSPRSCIVETKLQVRIWAKQHEESISKGNWNTSALAAHVQTFNNGTIDWSSVHTVKVEKKKI